MILRIICEQEKKLQPLSDEVPIDINSSLTWKTLQLKAAEALNFHIGTTSIIARQLYEGLRVDRTCTGLINWYKSSKIVPTNKEYSPETLKDYLPANHLKLYNLIWQHFNGNPPATKPIKTMTRYNDYLLMLELERRELPWTDIFATAVCSMMKRKYIELTEEGYKPTKLGLEIMAVLKEHFTTIISDKFIKKIETTSTTEDDSVSVVETFWKQFNGTLTKALTKIGDITPKDPPIVESDEVCDKCGKKMVVRRSRYGQFLACSGYPECNNTKPYFEYIKDDNCHCPKCGGRLTKRRWSKGNIYYSCEKYPECEFSTWDEPQSKPCEICGKTLFLHRFKDRAPMMYCGNEACSSRQGHPINKILKNQQQKRKAKEQKAAEKAKAKN